PHRLDLARPTRSRLAESHLAFSLGPHYCLGANLARLEIAAALGTVADRFPDLAPDGPTGWSHSFLFRNVVSLPVRL
ncbi:MAG TPA: cytochrome P450, partial [Acidimicrobiales bacterium]